MPLLVRPPHATASPTHRFLACRYRHPAPGTRYPGPAPRPPGRADQGRPANQADPPTREAGGGGERRGAASRVYPPTRARLGSLRSVHTARWTSPTTGSSRTPHRGAGRPAHRPELPPREAGGGGERRGAASRGYPPTRARLGFLTSVHTARWTSPAPGSTCTPHRGARRGWGGRNAKSSSNRVIPVRARDRGPNRLQAGADPTARGKAGARA